MGKCKTCGERVAPRKMAAHVQECAKSQPSMFSFVRPEGLHNVDNSLLIAASKGYPIGGVTIRFPFKPYKVQFQYMYKLIRALRNGENALLESPTGTGKTLCLLTSTLSWQQKEKETYLAALRLRCPLHDTPDKVIDHMLNQQQPSGDSPSTSHIPEDDSDYRTGRRFGSIAAVNIKMALVKKKRNLDNKSRTVHVFVKDVYRNTKVKRIERRLQDENSLVKVDIEGDRAIFVEIPRDCAKILQKDLFKKPSSPVETWVLEQPANNYMSPPKFIDHEVHGQSKLTPINVKDDEDKDFTSPKNSKISTASIKSEVSDTFDFEKSDETKARKLETAEKAKTEEPEEGCICDEVAKKKKSPPRIYFCTRTHRQIAQIVRELNKTEFSQIRMSILSSREHSCVNPRLEKESNKNDKCKDLRNDHMCDYGSNSSALTNPNLLRRHGITKAWDVEELCYVGKREIACPYYASVEMAKTADIVLCPYNYILDPFILSQRNLSLENNVVIFDEGHNIEDVCRSSVGFDATQYQIMDAITNIENVIKRDLDCMIMLRDRMRSLYGDMDLADLPPIEYESSEPQLSGMQGFLKTLLRWMLSFKNKLVDDYFEHSHYSLDGPNCLKQLKAIGITEDEVEKLSGWINVITEKEKENSENNDSPDGPKLNPPKPKSMTLQICSKFVITYRIFAMKGNAPSFSLCIQQSPLMVPDLHTKKPVRVSGLTLGINCLNPAVVFRDISSKCHSVIVTSGTLSPTGTFASELGTSFGVEHEGKHVVPKSNFLAMNLTAGPSGQSFNAGYKNAESYAFQDNVGVVIARVCAMVPHGVLVFFPSYRLLDKVCERWQSTGVWEQMRERKVVVCEPKGSNRNLFNEAMAEFDRNVEEGALLLAVCRGKISEGVDFADNNARAVLTIGLPFPNFKSTEVTDKRKYNDRFCKELGLLSGQEWYTIQAFRAVNQALGRCLRHVNDWGAIIMIESRLASNEKYWNGISRWIRDDMVVMNNCNDAFERLNYFCHDMLGTMDEYDMDGGASILKKSDVTKKESSPTTSTATDENKPSNNQDNSISIIDLTKSPTIFKSKSIPLFSGPEPKTDDVMNSKSKTDDITNSDSKASDVTNSDSKASDVTIVNDMDNDVTISSSPELFGDDDGCGGCAVEDKPPEKKSPPKVPVIAHSDDKRSLSPESEDSTNIVIKRRRVSRIQEELDYSTSPASSTSVTSSGTSVTSSGPGVTSSGPGVTSSGPGVTSSGPGVTSSGPGVTSSGPGVTSSGPESPTRCSACSEKLLKVRPDQYNQVKITDFVRGRYEVRAAGSVFTPFSDDTASELGNMGVFCRNCQRKVGVLVFRIGDEMVSGVVTIQ